MNESWLKYFWYCGGCPATISNLYGWSLHELTCKTEGLFQHPPTTAPTPSPFLHRKKHAKIAKKLNELGVSKLKIGKLFGVSESTVLKISKRDMWPLSNKAIGLAIMSKVEPIDIIQRYSSGETAGAIANSLGLKGHQAISKLLKDHGVEVFHTYDLNPEFEHKICNLYSKGKGIKPIADKLGYDAVVIRRILEKNKIKIRSFQESRVLVGEANRIYPLDIDNPNFHRDVWTLTERNYKLYTDEINPFGESRSRHMHLDHRYSIAMGAVANEMGRDHCGNVRVNSWELAHPANLKVIPAIDNLKKNSRCDFTIQQLRKAIRDFNNCHLCPYVFNTNTPFMNYLKSAYGDFNDRYEPERVYSRRQYNQSDCP